MNAPRYVSERKEAFADASPESWTYLPELMGPHTTLAAWQAWTERAEMETDLMWRLIVDAHSGRAVGIASET
jgi:hypothetical protein